MKRSGRTQSQERERTGGIDRSSQNLQENAGREKERQKR